MRSRLAMLTRSMRFGARVPQRTCTFSVTGMKYGASVTGERNSASRAASTMVEVGDRLKNTAISPNCRSASMMPTFARDRRASSIARFAMSVVLPLLPFGLKNVYVSPPTTMPLFANASTAFLSSSLVNGLTM